MPYTFVPALRDTMAARMASFERHAITDPALRHAAVAIIVAEGENAAEAAVLLTAGRRSQPPRRSTRFPAGGWTRAKRWRDAAALRETGGTRPDPRSIRDPRPTRRLCDGSGFCITPVVSGAVPPSHSIPIPTRSHACFACAARTRRAEVQISSRTRWCRADLRRAATDARAQPAAPTRGIALSVPRSRAARLGHACRPLEQPRFAWT